MSKTNQSPTIINFKSACRAVSFAAVAALFVGPAACDNGFAPDGGIGSDGSIGSDGPAGVVQQAVQSSDPGCASQDWEPVWPLSGSTTPDVSVDEVQDVYGPIVRGGKYYIHRGIDFAGNTGDPIYAVADGWVARIGVHCGETTIPDGYCEGGSDPHNTQSNYPGSGHWVMIKHYADDADGRQLSTRYIHLSEFADGLDEGDCVQAGDLIGYMGQSGNANTEHLHLELYSLPHGAFPSASLSNTRNPYEVLPYDEATFGVPFEAELIEQTAQYHVVQVRANPLHADLGRITTALVQGNSPNLQDLELKGDGILSKCKSYTYPTTGKCNYGNGTLDVKIEPIDFNTGDSWAIWNFKYDADEVTSGELRLVPIGTDTPVKASAQFSSGDN